MLKRLLCNTSTSKFALNIISTILFQTQMGEQLCRRGQPQTLPAVRLLGVCHLHVFHGPRADKIHFLHQRWVPLPLWCLPPVARDLFSGGKYLVWTFYAVHVG